MGHFLPEQHQKRLLRRGQHALEHKAAEIEQHRGKRERQAAGQAIDDTRQQQRRQE